MKKTSFWLGILLAIILTIPSAVSAQQKVRGVTDTEIVIGWNTPLSGPAALWGVTGLGGKAWLDYINDQGGIHGRKIKVILKDDGYNPARALANLQEMKNEVFAVTALLGTAVVHACRDFFHENKMPLINAYGNTRMFEDYPKDKLRYIFVSYPDYRDEAGFLTKWAYKNLGSRKFAIFYQNDDYGKLGWLGMANGVGQLPGAETVAAVPYGITERALSAHALKLKESGADTILLYTSPVHGPLVLKEMAKVGYRPKVLTSFPLGDPIMYKIAGEVWEGVYPAGPNLGGMPGVDPDADRIADILKKYNPKIAGKEYLGLFGAVSSMYLVEGLKRAGRNLNPETMIRGMESIKNWQSEAGGAKVTFGPNRHHGANGSRLYHAQGGKHLPQTDFVMYQPRF
jgi:ABC-type branched-subunit amino acid transport system substrate-binding protein